MEFEATRAPQLADLSARLNITGCCTWVKVRGLVEFYVAEHNGRIPHGAFQGQTPDEMYFGSGEHVPDTLAVAKVDARQARIAENRARRCAACK